MSHKPGWLDQLLSVLAAMFGVQSERNRERDFSSGQAWRYVLLGVLMTGLFVLCVILLVRLVLSMTGA